MKRHLQRQRLRFLKKLDWLFIYYISFRYLMTSYELLLSPVGKAYL